MVLPDRISVLFVAPYPIVEAGIRHRIYQFLPHLQAAGFSCTVRPFASEQLYAIRHSRAYAEKIVRAAAATTRRLSDLLRARRYDLIYIHREIFPFGTPLVERLFHSVNPRLILSFDDAIYIGHRSGDSFVKPLLYQWKYGRGVNWVIQNSVHVVVGNRFLAAYARGFNPNVSVIPTVVDTDKFLPRPMTANTTIRIGWMGSRSTSPYLQPLAPIVRELTRRYKERIEFHIYGDPTFPKPVPEAVVRPFDLKSEVPDLQSFDIGIMPMPDDEWTRGKCAFKAIQYMAVGTPVVASPVGMVDELIEEGKSGLLAQSPSEWVEKLSLLIENEELRRRIGQEGRRKIERDFSLRAWAPRFVQLLRGVYESKDPSVQAEPRAVRER